VVAILLALFLAALGPATDADSLDYHLGVPLEWLRAGGAYPRLDWLSGRLAGLGEALNLLGLAAGTDALGAMLQWGGLVTSAIAVGSFAEERRDRLLAALLVAGTPVVLFLTPSQKPQLLGVAATTVALAIAAREWGAIDRAGIALASACLGVAVGTKYSFLLGAAPIAAALLVAARRGGNVGRALALLALAFAVFPLPVLARNWAFYGDPLTPLLERFRAAPDPAVVAFAEYLRSYAGDRSLRAIVRLPLDLAVTFRPGLVSTVLGLGTLAFVPAIGTAGTRGRVLLVAAGALAALTLAFGQLAGRFFLEPYLWAGAALVACRRDRVKGIFGAALTVQAAGVAVLAAATAVVLAPGALSAAAREEVMAQAAFEHAEMRWLDEVLPSDARILLFARSRALAPRPFVSGDRIRAAAGAAGAGALAEAVLHDQVSALVFPVGAADARVREVEEACATGAVERTFATATRNPFNRGASQTIRVLMLRLDERCRGRLAQALEPASTSRVVP
jgi:hypothetical protein